MKDGNRPYSITYQISYALSNTRHSEEFKDNDHISIPSLFETIEKTYKPEQFEIDLDREFSLNVEEKPMILGESTSIKLPLTWSGREVASSSRLSISDTGSDSNSMSNSHYKIIGEYWNIYDWKPLKITISPSLSASYINSQMVNLYDKKILAQPHRYIDDKALVHDISYYVIIKLRFGIHEIELKLLEDRQMSSDQEGLLGLDFLEQVKPRKITPKQLTFQINQQTIHVGK